MISDLTLADVRIMTDEVLMFARGQLDKQCHDAADEFERAEAKFALRRRDRDRVLKEIERRGL